MSLKDRMPNGIKQAILKQFEYEIVAKLASKPGIPKKYKHKVPVFWTKMIVVEESMHHHE